MPERTIFRMTSDEALQCWQNMFSADKVIAASALMLLLIYHYRQIYAFIYHTLHVAPPMPGVGAPGARLDVASRRRLANDIFQSAVERAVDIFQAGGFVQLGAMHPGRRFGYHFYEIVEQTIDDYAIVYRWPNWRTGWASSEKNTPFGQGARLIYQDVFWDEAIHHFAREIHIQIEDGSFGLGSVDRMAMFATVAIGLNRIRDLMEHKYAYQDGVLLIDSLDRLPLLRKARLILRVFFGYADETIINLCPPDPSQDSSDKVHLIIAALDRDHEWLTQSPSWGPVEFSLSQRAGGVI